MLYYFIYIQRQQTPIDIAKQNGDKKAFKVLTKWKYAHRFYFPSLHHKGSKLKKSSSSTEMSPFFTSLGSMSSFNSQARSSVSSDLVIPEVDDSDDTSDDDDVITDQH